MFAYVTATAAAVVIQPWALIPIAIVASLDFLASEMRRSLAAPQSFHDSCARIDYELRIKEGRSVEGYIQK